MVQDFTWTWNKQREGQAAKEKQWVKTRHSAITLVNLDAETTVPVCEVIGHLWSQSSSPPVQSLMKK